jgi:hypothetical protein
MNNSNPGRYCSICNCDLLNLNGYSQSTSDRDIMIHFENHKLTLLKKISENTKINVIYSSGADI